MALRVCAEPTCPELVEQGTPLGRCPAHRQQRERERGTRQQRGYDRAFDLHRKREARKVAKGKATCWSCGRRISPLEPWDDGHCDNDRAVIHGAQCITCNRGTSRSGPCAHPSHN